MKISYAQNCEDILLNRLFDDGYSGFYIDIGASDPVKYSVTKLFYDKGWTGINIDPRPDAIAAFNEQRPRDINIQCAISSGQGYIEFCEVKNYPELSGCAGDLSSIDRLKSNDNNVEKYMVSCQSANQIFESLNGRVVDFLKIDVEGHEKNVLVSLDLIKYRPRVIVIESTIPDAQFPGWDSIESILSDKDWSEIILKSDYIFAYFDGLNKYYIRSEDSRLASRLSIGPCHWDNYVPFALSSQIENLQYHCDKRMEQIEELTAAVMKSNTLISKAVKIFSDDEKI